MSDIEWEPTRLLSMLVRDVESVFEGNELIVDPSMPWPYLMETSVVLAAGAISRDEVLNTEQYPVMAKGDDGLFKHMTDKDYEGMFGTPDVGWFDIFMSVAEITQFAVRVGQTGTKKICIPKHSQIVVNNAAFTFQYPINIIVKSHGGIDIVYDGSNPSPLQTLLGNKVDKEFILIPAQTPGQAPIQMVKMRVQLKQMLLTPYIFSPSTSKALRRTVPLTDNFYYVRAFAKSSDGLRWTPIKSTHSQQVFDPTDPTLLLQVADGALTIELPYVYTLTNLVSSDIRVDVYTMKSPQPMALGGLDPNAFTMSWKDLDNDDNGIYSSPLSVMSTISVSSTDMTGGGTASPTFDTRRLRVINNNIGDQVIPISKAHLGTTLADLGFDATINIDDVTNRTVLASRAMPDNTDGQASTGIDAAVITMKSTVADLVGRETVYDNGDRVTLTPLTLYRSIDGVLTMVPDADRKAIDQLSGDALVNKVSDGTYLYSPLHYVLDTSNHRFEVRPYFLDAPTIDTTSFVASNDTLALSVSSGSTKAITRDETGYTLQVLSSSNDIWKALRDDQVWVQMAYRPTGESDYAYINGRQIAKSQGGERVFEFRLETQWDISDTHELTLTNFNMYEPSPRKYPTPLHNDFSLIWAVSDYTVVGAETTQIDIDLGEFLLPYGSRGVYHETLNIALGDQLAGLWSRSRSMIGQRKYLTYQRNVQAVYTSDEYETVGGIPVIEVVDGQTRLKVKNAKGTLKFNPDGSPIWAQAIGNAVMDEYGNPVMESERNIVRYWDICLFDGVYRWASDAKDSAYVNDVPKVLVDWINDILAPVAALALDETEILFQPRNTLKQVDVMVEDSALKTIHTAQSLKVDVYVTREVYADDDLRAALKASTIAQVIAGLDATQVTKLGLEKSISDNAGTDIATVDLSGLGGVANNFNIITLLDESSRLCVAKALMAKADGTYAVVDGIEVNFKLHADTRK